MEWNEIKTDEDIRYLNEIYHNFEDSLIVSMEYVSGDYVDRELLGHMEMTNDLKVIFQRLDNDPFSIELWFTNTKMMNFVFANYRDNRLSDIMYAKVCRNNEMIFWTLWEDFDPYREDHIPETVLIGAYGLKWRIVKDKA